MTGQLELYAVAHVDDFEKDLTIEFHKAEDWKDAVIRARPNTEHQIILSCDSVVELYAAYADLDACIEVKKVCEYY